MKTWLLTLLGCAISLSAGAVAPSAPGSAEQVSYFTGTHQVLSPDGQISYASGKVVMKRTVNSEAGTILEESRRTGLVGNAGSTVSKLTRIDQTSQFSVQDPAVESGIVTFNGDTPWVWTSSVYEARLKDGTTVTGAARMENNEYSSLRIVRSAKKTPLFKHVEELKAVSGETYRRMLLEVTDSSTRADF